MRLLMNLHQTRSQPNNLCSFATSVRGKMFIFRL